MILELFYCHGSQQYAQTWDPQVMPGQAIGFSSSRGSKLRAQQRRIQGERIPMIACEFEFRRLRESPISRVT
uniref:Uncharacterized protein n=1 Tax=Medicago truncatula TaxID=3880 RepID=A2Q6H6_MEDTR|nr:hypothetical protein MtrDRAFT_AC184047g1v2 [Medicago truncatula]